MTADPTADHSALEHDATRPALDASATESAAPGSWVVVVATSPAERARIARRLGALAPLVMARTPAEAHAILATLGGTAPPADAAADATSSASGDETAAPGGGSVTAITSPVSVSGLVIDTDLHVARTTSMEARLTPLEHSFMLCLLRRPGRVWTFAELTRSVWGTDHMGSTTGNVHAVVKRLRHKLAEIEAPVSIQAIRGIGFRLSDSGAAAPGLS